jgi:flagellar biosynthesis/type III secretory pathway protein FliH
VEEQKENAEIYSQRIKAGKRTYFFDIKSTRSNDYYLTITESKKRFKEEGFYYEKHKIFLYKEDFHKFIEALQQTVDYLKTELMPEVDFEKFENAEFDSEADESDLKWD